MINENRRPASFAPPATVMGLWLAACCAGMLPAVVAAQDLVPPPVWAVNDLACAPFLTTVAPLSTIRVVGSQDTVVKGMLDSSDTLVLSGGASEGLAEGQEYFVRRLKKPFGARGPDASNPLGVHTVAWVRIVGVAAGLSTASVVHACEGILLDDYLEPFSPPMIASGTPPGGTAQYDNMGRIVMGDDARELGAIGDLMIVDRGSSTGVVPGQRFIVFRDHRGGRIESSGRSAAFLQGRAALPLVEVGEIVAIFVRQESTTVQIITARDAVQAGDLVAPIR